MPSIADLVEEPKLGELVGDDASVLSRGRKLADAGAVRLSEAGPLEVTAEVVEGDATTMRTLTLTTPAKKGICDGHAPVTRTDSVSTLLRRLSRPGVAHRSDVADPAEPALRRIPGFRKALRSGNSASGKTITRQLSEQR